MTSLRIRNSTTPSGLLAAAAALLAACSVNESGNIPCFDDSNCPAAYPSCKGATASAAGKCVEAATGGGGTTPTVVTVSTPTVVGFADGAFIAGDFHVQVTAKSNDGIKKVELKAGTATLTPGTSSAPPLYDFLITAPAGTGDLAITATVTAGDDTAKTSSAITVHFDNDPPVLTLADPAPQAARAGGLITVDVATSEKLASISGDVFLAGSPDTKVGTLSVISNTSDTAWKLGFAAPTTAAAGVYKFTVTGKDPAGNASAAVTKQTTLYGSFTVTSVAVTGSGTIGGLPAGKLSSTINVTAKIPIAVPVLSGAASFALVDAASHKRSLPGTVAVTTDATSTTFKIADAVTAADVDGTANLQVTVTDAAGNVATGSAQLLVDKTAPFLVGLAPSATVADAQTGTPAGTVVLTGTASEPLASASFTVAGAGGATGSCKCDVGSGAAACAGGSVAPVVTCAVPVPAITSPTPVSISIQLADVIGNASVNTANTTGFQALPVPVLTTGAVAPVTARPGSQVTVVVNSTQPLSSLSGTAVNGASSVTMALVSGALGQAGPYTMGFVVPATGAVAGSYTMTLVGKGLAGGTTASVGASATVALPFSVGSVTVSTGTTEPSGSGTLPAGATNATLTIVAKVPGGVPLDAGAAVFSITDSLGHSRTLAGSYSTSADGSGNQVLTIADSIAAGDANGVAQVSVVITDRGGNQASGSASFIVDTAAPFLIGFAPNFTSADTARACANGTCTANASGKVTFTGKASEPITSATFSATGAGAQTNVACTCDGGSCASSSTTAAPLVTCVVDVPGGVGLVAAAAVNVTVTLKDAVANTSSGSSTSNQGTFQAIPLPTASAFGTTTSVSTGVAAPITATFPAGNTALVTNDQLAPSFPIFSGTAVNVTPATTSKYTLTVTNPVGSSFTFASQVTVTVVSPGFTGTMTFVEPIVTIGRATAMVLNIPTLTGAASATLLDNTGNAPTKSAGGTVTSSDILNASGATLSINPPSWSGVTTTTQFSYTLIVLNSAVPPVASTTSAILTALPVPTVTVTPNITLVTTGNQVQLTVKTTGAACTTAGLCQVINNKDATVIAVLGDTNAVAGVTVSATVDQTKTYTAQVKNGATIPAFVNSSPATAITAVPVPTAALTANLATVTINNGVNLTVKTTSGACTVSGNCEIFNDKDATILPVVGDANQVAGVTVSGVIIDQAKTFTVRVKNGAQDAVFVNSTGLPIATRPAPAVTLTTTLASPATAAVGNLVPLTVKTTNAACTVSGNCQIVNDKDGTVIAVVGDTSVPAGVTVNATLDVNKTYTAQVKANAADTIFVNSTGLLVTCVSKFLVAGFTSPSVAGVAASVTVTAQDAGSVTAPGYRGTVHFTTNDVRTGVVLPADYTFLATETVPGVHTFTNGVTLTTVTTTGTITATDTTSATTNGTQSGITITPAVANKLAFNVQPTNTVSQTNISPAVVVEVQDSFGNRQTSSTVTVTLAIQTNPGSGTLSGAPNTAAVAGQATFSTAKIDKAGTGYVLRATSSGLTLIDSNTFNITPGAANKLAYGQQPTDAVSSTSISPAITVLIQDASGNTVTSSVATVTLAIQANPGSGTLSGAPNTAAVAGVATFSTAKIDKAGAGYTLRTTSSGLTLIDSNTFNITPGAANKLAYGQQPTNTVSQTNISPAITVLIQDAAGNTVTSSSATVTLAIQTNPGSGTLSGAPNTAAVAGVATFSAAQIDKAGTGYVLRATSSGVTLIDSNTFNITPGSATQLSYLQQPSNTTSSTNISPAITVLIQDPAGNTVTSSVATVTLAILANPGGGALSGASPTAAVAGVATFSTAKIDKTGNGYSLRATSSGLTQVDSGTFNITPGGASKLAFSQQPTDAVSSTSIAPAITVLIQDAAGNTVTSSSATVTLAIQTNPGSGTLSGAPNTAAVSGVATFSTAKIDKAGAGYVLRATSSGLTLIDSNTFNITPGAANKLGYGQPPTNTVSATNISPAMTVLIQDAAGNTVTSSTATVTLAIQTNPGGGTLSGAPNTAAVAGVATFSTAQIDKAGNGYVLRATSSGLTLIDSNTFNITPGAANKLAFNQQPTDAASSTSIAPAITVLIQDAAGNTVTSSSATVTLAIQTNPGSGTLSGAPNTAAVSGVATFSTAKIDKAGTGYVLRATSSGVTLIDSNTFNITPGAANKLAYGQPPTNTVSQTNISPAITVLIQDAAGNTVTSSTATVTLAIQTNPGGGTLSGAPNTAAVAGVATFSAAQIDKAGTGYVLRATSSGVTLIDSSPFNITFGAANKLAYGQPPTTTTSATNITPAITVLIQDAAGNTVTNSVATVTLAIQTNPGSGTLSGAPNTAAVAGVATFSAAQIDKKGTGYVLRATSSGVTLIDSSPFNITVGAASKLGYGQQPSNTALSTSIAPAITVLIQDAGGNTVTSSSATVTLAIQTNPGGGALTGAPNTAAVSGVATFSAAKIDKFGNGYVLRATSSGVTLIDSNPFNITPIPTFFGAAALIVGSSANAGKVFLAGGNDTLNGAGTDLKTTWIFDPSTATYVKGPDMNTARSFHTATAIGSDKVVIAGGSINTTGGSSDREFEICDLSGTPACTTVGTTAVRVSRCNAAAAVGNAGRVVILGGDNCSNSTALDTWDLLDTGNSNAVTQTTGGNHLSSGRRLLTATSLGSGKILLAGGAATATADLFTDAATPSIAAVAGGMKAIRGSHTATLLAAVGSPPAAWTTLCPSNSGCVLIAGGLFSPTVTPSWEVYDSTLGFSTAASGHEMQVPARYLHVAAQFTSGRVLVAGGSIDPTTPTTGLSTTEYFDPSATTPGWTTGFPMTIGRLEHAGAYSTSGSEKLNVFGGSTSQPQEEQLSAP